LPGGFLCLSPGQIWGVGGGPRRGGGGGGRSDDVHEEDIGNPWGMNRHEEEDDTVEEESINPWASHRDGDDTCDHCSSDAESSTYGDDEFECDDFLSRWGGSDDETVCPLPPAPTTPLSHLIEPCVSFTARATCWMHALR